ncbi:MAG: DASS family sodium-coupled anion symporter [Deltaproteobacteria bacterium]|nr:DASS family sodium-coupled anion symporter [Deltaproteobacteria bacterium]
MSSENNFYLFTATMKFSWKNLCILILAMSAVPALALSPLAADLPTRVSAGIFALALILWVTEAVPLYVTSLLILFFNAAFLAPLVPVKHTIFLAPFFSDIIALFLGGLLLAEAGHKYHIDEWFADWILRFSGSKPRNILLAMMITTATLSMWMSNTATTAMMLLIAGAVIVPLGEGSDFAKAFFIGIPFSANLGGMMTPVGTPPNAIAMQAINNLQPGAMTFLDWMLVSCPLVILLLLILWGLLLLQHPAPKIRITTRPDFHIRFNLQTITVMIIFFLTVILWLTKDFHGMTSGTVALIPAIVFLGTGILDKRDFKNISWDVLFLVGGGLSLAVAMKEGGLNDFMIQQLPINELSLGSLMLVFILVGAVLTTFMSNTATANLIVPLAFIIPGITGLPLAIGTALAVSATMIMPVSTPPNAIAYSSGLLTMKDMVRTGFIISLIAIVVIVTLGYGWWRLLGYF